MAKFLTELDAPLKPESDTVYILHAPLVYESDIVGLIEVPTGFETDLASVPRFPIVYWFFGGRLHREAVLHDYLFRKDSKPVVPYSQANSVFLEAATVRGKKACIRYPMYWGVVLGGWTAYHKKNVMDKIV